MNNAAEALEKAYIYKIFSLIFYPDKLNAGLKKIREAVNKTFNGGSERLGLILDVVEQLCNEQSIRELEMILGEMRKHEPLERKLVLGPSIGAVLADLAGFYKAFNLKTNSEIPMDHLSVELEFMANLSLRKAYAILNDNKEMLEIVTKAERDFLRDHLSRTAAYVAVLKNAKDKNILDAAGLFEDFMNMELEKIGAPKLPSSVEVHEGEKDVIRCPFA